MIFLKLSILQAVIFVDGHFSHVYNLQLVEFCMARQIEIVVFPSGQTSKLQPFDVKVFGPLKVEWNKYLNKLDRSVDKVGHYFGFFQFHSLMQTYRFLECFILQNFLQ